MLPAYRVIDSTDERGQLAGFVLAQLGADVVLVEPPGGSPARHLPPFADDRPGVERSLWHWSYNRAKRSVLADPATPAGLARLRSLLADADVWLWTGTPAGLPFGPDELTAINPRLVAVVLTPFGLDGPKAHWAATDLTIAAASGASALVGDRDRAPLRWGSPQAFLHGAADMAVAALVALAERHTSGRGQLVELSAQECAMAATFCYTVNAAWSAPLMGRSGDGVDFGRYKNQWTFPAADGSVSITFSFGASLAHFTTELFRWIFDEGGCDEATRDLPFAELTARLAAGTCPPAEVDRLNAVIAAFTATRTKAELFAEAGRRRVLLAPIATLGEVLDSPHLADRGFWDTVTHPEADRPHRLPGRFVRSTATPLPVLGRAPLLGEHDTATLDRTDLARPDANGPDANGPDANGHGGALAGLRVLDLAWSIAGPLVGRTLADHGATVVRVEHRDRPCVGRTTGPFHPDRDRNPFESSAMWANVNAGKLGVELDLSRPEGVDVCLDLAAWADVVVESFSAGALARMGLGYERLRERNPGIVLLSTCLPGQTGNLQLPGLGNLATAMFGLTDSTGWPDRPPSGPFGAYTDIIAPRFGVAAVLAALEHRRRTGEGQHLDLSQAEASLHLYAPALAEAELNGRDVRGRGNRDLVLAPHGVYPARGEDRWVAIAAQDDTAWQALAALLDRSDLAGLPVAERRARQDELDDVLTAWSTAQDPEELQALLQRHGIAAHQVQTSPECLADPQLAHRGHYLSVPHPVWGPVVVEGSRLRLSRTPPAVHTPGPVLGRDTDHVLGELLGHHPDRIDALRSAGVLGPTG